MTDKKLAEEQFKQFVEDTKCKSFTYDDFKNWQNKAYKEHKITVLFAWWAIHEAYKTLCDKYKIIYRYKRDYMDINEVLEVLNENCDIENPNYFYDEESNMFYQKYCDTEYILNGEEYDSKKRR